MNTVATSSLIRIAAYDFNCPVTGIRIRKGENYVEVEGVAMSLTAGLPTRRLRLLGRRQK
jgi:hypothetical protein